MLFHLPLIEQGRLLTVRSFGGRHSEARAENATKPPVQHQTQPHDVADRGAVFCGRMVQFPDFAPLGFGVALLPHTLRLVGLLNRVLFAFRTESE